MIKKDINTTAKLKTQKLKLYNQANKSAMTGRYTVLFYYKTLGNPNE